MTQALLTALAVYLIVGLSLTIRYIHVKKWTASKHGRWWRIPAAFAFGVLVLPIAHLVDGVGKCAR